VLRELLREFKTQIYVSVFANRSTKEFTMVNSGFPYSGNKIQKLRKYTEDHDEPSPESRRQYEMVLSWVEGE
jgi:hypothetical protein